MPLKSKHFRGNARLEACLVSNSQHVVPGSRGDHVGKIQEALILLGAGVINAAEVSSQHYGTTTQNAVLGYKTKRKIINNTYQNSADNIVGIMTIERLDLELVELEKTKKSQLVSETSAGQPHDHSKCPRLQAGEHERTPINPQRFGRMINIFGDHETDYLGFEDYAIDPKFKGAESGTIRPLTWDKTSPRFIPANRVSDISMRSIPVFTAAELERRGDKGFPSIMHEIKRIAMPGCRITFSGEEIFARRIIRLGVLIERVEIKSDVIVSGVKVGEKTDLAFVVGFIAASPGTEDE
jgi:hypothetical protein